MKWYYYPLLATILIWLSSNQIWTRQHDRYTCILNDGKGYYSYLPAIFIYKDLNFGFFDQIETKYYKGHEQEYRIGINGKDANKYYIGTSILMLPFFVGGHTYAYFSQYPTDGYSQPYQIAIHLATIFYCLLGLFFLQKLLSAYSISVSTQIRLALFVLLGTHVFYFTVYEPSNSHVYSFCSFNAFAYFIRKWKTAWDSTFLLLAAFCFGLIVLIRPINLLILGAIPFLLESPVILQQAIKKSYSDWKNSLFGVLLISSILFLQLIFYKLSTGNWVIYSYGNERFYWNQPHFWQMLFSYRKGLFLYTPLTLIGTICAFVYFQRQRAVYLGVTWILYLVLLIYIFSCWHMWWYGGGFSHRVFLEYLFLFVIPIGMGFSSFSSRTVRLLRILGILCICLNLIQTLQYRYFFLHWDNTTKTQYWEHFLRIDELLKVM